MKAHELLKDPNKWCQGSYAYTEKGEEVSGYHPDAIKFCIYGAIEHCYGMGDLQFSQSDRVLKYVRDRYNDTPISLNDSKSTTHEMVYNILKELDI